MAFGITQQVFFAVQMKGSFRPNVTGLWRLDFADPTTHKCVDDSLNVSLNHQIKTFSFHSFYNECYVEVNLTANVNYPIVMRYVQYSSAAYINVGIIPPNGTLTYDGSPYFQGLNGQACKQSFFHRGQWNISSLITKSKSSYCKFVFFSLKPNLIVEINTYSYQLIRSTYFNLYIYIFLNIVLSYVTDMTSRAGSSECRVCNSSGGSIYCQIQMHSQIHERIFHCDEPFRKDHPSSSFCIYFYPPLLYVSYIYWVILYPF